MIALRPIIVAPARTLLCALALLMSPLLPITPAVAAEPARPSFEAASELFELVGRVRDGRLTLLLDRWASNEPVTGAHIEIDLNGRNLVAEAQADGTYSLDAAPFATPATYPLTITVTAGEESDLLATDFVVAAETAPANGLATGTARIGAVLVAVLAVAVAVAAIRRRRKGEHA